MAIFAEMLLHAHNNLAARRGDGCFREQLEALVSRCFLSAGSHARGRTVCMMEGLACSDTVSVLGVG
jgi:hypothetical protein